MPHIRGQCVGWVLGGYTPDQCRSCWVTRNPATAKPGTFIPPVVVSRGPRAANAGQLIRPVCKHFGEIQQNCPIGDTQRDVHGCNCDVADWTRCWRSSMPNTDKDIKSCEQCPHFIPDFPYDRVTVTVTYWERPDSLIRLQQSLKRCLPKATVLVEDTAGNLSAGRNRLIAKTTTEFVIVMEEDFELMKPSVVELCRAVEILDTDKKISGVGGTCYELPQRKLWGHNYRRRGDDVLVVSSQRPMRSTPSGVSYLPCDLVLNWGLFRTEAFRQVPWNESLPIMEHKERFWRSSQAGQEYAFYAPLSVRHYRDRPNEVYNKGRRRNYNSLIQSTYGIRFIES